MKVWMIVLITLCCSCVNLVETGSVVKSSHGVVVCVDEIASLVGTDILDQGGNAVDAAVAMAFALAVTHPQAGNLGGGGFMLLRMADGRETSIDYRERAPAAARPNLFLEADGTVNKDKVRYGFLGSGVPGTVAGLYLAHVRYGKLEWSRLVEPARSLAERGFKVDFDLARVFKKNEKGLRRFPSTVKAFFRQKGRLPDIGYRLMQPDLARTLEAIKHNGQDGFYQGEVAKELVRAIREGGGIISATDLETYFARERKPHRFSYRGYELLTMGLPSSGGLVLDQMLKVLYGFVPGKMEEADRAHLLAEILRRGFRDRALYLGDPEFNQPPLDRILSWDYAETLRDGIDLAQATPSHSLAGDLKINLDPDSDFADPGTGQTTHFCVVDAEGNIVSNTYTLEQNFGGKAVAGSTGVLMNNEMGDFNLRPEWTCEDGSIGTSPNLIAPGKRMLSSMCPVILLKEGAPVAAFGSPGGRTIISTLFQMVVNLVDLKMSMEQAVRAPRLHHGWFPDQLRVEKSMPRAVVRTLEAKGHRIKEVDYQGDCHALHFSAGGNVEGVADTRIDGCAAGL